MNQLISKSCLAIAFFSMAVLSSLTPVMAESTCNTTNTAAKEQKQVSSVIKKIEYFKSLASQIDDREMARQIEVKLDQAIQENQAKLEQLGDLGQAKLEPEEI